MAWYKKLIKKRWTFNNKKKKPGRPSVSSHVKQLILKIKNDNIFMRTGKIQGELVKLGITISQSSIRRILRDFRKQGKVKSDLTWSTFIISHLSKLFAMDFFTVESLFSRSRYYVFFIMHLETRKIVQVSITDFPTCSFVRNQLCEFSSNYDASPYLIHDSAGEFVCQDYQSLGIKNIKTSAYAPNMNAYAERFVGSVRRELLDNFIIFSYDQLYRLCKEYITYYNTFRPHQGINQQTPEGYTPETEGEIVKVPVLGGLWNHYTRVAA
jgi:transposase InsO family protein